MIDSLVDGAGNASQALADLGKSLLKMVLKAQIFKALAGLFPKVFGPSGSIPLIDSNASGTNFSGAA